MIVDELKNICKLVSISGLIDEFTICKDGHILGFDIAKTIIVDMKYNITLPCDISISNVNGVNEVLSKFPDNTNIEILENQLHIVKDTKFYKILLKPFEKLKLNIPIFTENDYQVIAKNIDNKILNNLGKLRVQSLTDEYYYLYVKDKNLMFRVGDENSSHGGDSIGIIEKCTSNEIIIFTMNISETFKNILTNANISIIFGKLMMIECSSEKYNVKYYLAPRVE